MSDSVQILNPGPAPLMGVHLSRSTYLHIRQQYNWGAIIALTANMAVWALVVAIMFAVFG